MQTLSKLHYTAYELIKEFNGRLLRGIIAKEITSNKLKLISIDVPKRPRLVGTFDNANKSLHLTTNTEYCQYEKSSKEFQISVGMLWGLPPTRLINIGHNGKTYTTTTKYLFFKGTNQANHIIVMNKKDFGLITAQIWENFIDTRHLNQLSVFDLYALKISFTQYYWALESSEVYRKRFFNELVDSADNGGGQSND